MKPALYFGEAKIEVDGHNVQVWGAPPYKLIKKDGTMVEWTDPFTHTWVYIPAQDTFKLDIPGEDMLHKFRGMQYLGPVERDDGIEAKINELLVKFHGALVVYHDCNVIDVLHNTKLIAYGCGALMDVIGKENLEYSARSVPSRATYYSISSSVVSLESIRTAKANKEEFLKNYERMMKL